MELLEYLRTSTGTLEAYYAKAQQACRRITGLGIAFFTKLLFFFRPQQDAYILDKWTTWDATLLFQKCPIRVAPGAGPSTDTSAESFAWYCSALEGLGPLLGTVEDPWSGEEVERAIFDRPGGEWRNYVRSFFVEQQPPRPPRQRIIGNGGGSDKSLLAKRIQRAHQALPDGTLLPSDQVSIHDTTPTVSVFCCFKSSIRWEYLIQQNWVNAKILFLRQAVPAYDKLVEHLGIVGHDFGEGIESNGADNGATRAIWIKVPGGANTPEAKREAMARQCVEAMNDLHERVGQYL